MGLTLGRRKQLIFSAMETMLDSTEDYMFVKDAELLYVAASKAFLRMVGRGSVSEIVGKSDFDLFTDQRLAQHYRDDDLRMLAEGKSLGSFVEPLPSVDGQARYSQTSKSLVRDPAGNVIGVFATGRDVTNEYLAKLNYERERRYLLELPDDAYRGVLLDVTDWKFVESRENARASGTVCDSHSLKRIIRGVTESIVEGEAARQFFFSFTQEHLKRVFSDGIRNLTFPYRRRMDDDSTRWVREEVHLMVNPITQHLEALIVLRGIDEQMAQKDLLVRAAQQDSMTGLLNHESTMDFIRNYLLGAGKDGTHALFMIDIDNFKDVNDRFGHQRGDSAIVSTAAAIRGAFRESDVVGRIGGDEFLALMKKTDDIHNVIRKAEAILASLSEIGSKDATPFRLSGSIGVSVYHGGRRQPVEALYAQADAALYRAKHNGKNCYEIADECEAEPAPREKRRRRK